MAFSITGGKYASTTITTVGTTTFTASGAAFASGDFGVTRLVGMWNSGGTTFLGMAWVRSWVSATVLQLQTPFFDPATGLTVTQTVGNIILISKNFADSVTTGLTVTAPDIVTFTDTPTFGGTTSTGVCFYDERQNITCPFTMNIGGGLTVFGKLDNYSTNATSSPCIVNWSSLAGSSVALVTTNANSNFAMYGGRFDGSNSPLYHGGYNGTAGYTFVLNGVQCPFDLISPGAGGSWGTYASRAQLVNCISTTTATNAICRRWGDGFQSGGSFNFPNNTSGPISALGSDTAGTYSFSAPPGQRAVVLDFGANQTAGASPSPVLFRAGSASAITLNVTNLIGTNYYQGQANGPVTANGSGVSNVYFQDTFSNLVSGTVGNINTTALTSAASVYSTASTTSWSPSLLYQVVTGFTTTTSPPAAWYYGLKAYGKQIVSGTITPTTYALVAANGTNVSFQQSVNQLTDTGVGAVTQATANAYSSIATLDQLYAASSNWASLSAANATYPSIGSYPITYSGAVLNLGNLNLVLATTGAAFSINTGTNTLTINCTTLATGSIFTSFTTTGSVTVGTSSITVPYASSAGTSGVITLTNLLAGSTVVTDIGVATTSSGTSLTIYTAPGAYPTLRYAVTKFGYIPIYATVSGTSGAVSVTISQAADVGITQSTQATVAAYTTLSTLDQLYDYWSYYLYTGAAGSGPTQYFTNVKSGAWSGAVLSKAGTGISVLAVITNLTLTTAAISGTQATSSTTLVIAGVGATLAVGASTYQTLSATGVTTFTLTGVTPQFVYTTNAGTSLAVSLTVPTGSSVAVLNGSAALVSGSFVTVGGTAYTFYTTPGQTGTWTYKVTKYGSLPASTTFTPSGQVTGTVSLVPDTGITQATAATVAAYTVISTLDTLYDYGAYWETTSAGIIYSRPAVKSGIQITLGSASVTFNATASTIWAYTGTALTVKCSTVSSGTTFASLITTSTATFSNGAVNQAVLYTSGGNSGILTITGLSSHTVYLQNNSAVQQAYVASASGTYTFYTPIGSTGTWIWVLKKAGYSASTGTILASTGGLYTSVANTPQKLNADGSVMYTGSSSPLCTVSFNGTTEADILIGNGAVNVQAILDTTETALITNPGMIWLAVYGECSQFLSATGNFIFLTTKWRFKALNTSSPNATVNGYALSADGTPLNAVNGSITFLSNILVQQVAAAVWQSLAASYTGTGTFGNLVQQVNNGIVNASILVPYSGSF